MLRDPEHLLPGAVGHGAHGGRSLLIAFPPSASRVYSEPKRAAAEDPASTRPCHHCRKTRFPENADQKPSRTQRTWLTRGPTRDTGRCTCLPLQPKQHKSDQHVEDARCIVHSSQDPSQSISLPRLPPFGSLLTHEEVAQPRVVSVGVGSKLCLDDVGEALRLFESRYQSPCLLVIKHRFSLWACTFLGCWLVSVLINGICVCVGSLTQLTSFSSSATCVSVFSRQRKMANSLHFGSMKGGIVPLRKPGNCATFLKSFMIAPAK